MSPSTAAELSSLTTQLGELSRRISALAERLGTSDEGLAQDLFALERPLAEAARRLERITRQHA